MNEESIDNKFINELENLLKKFIIEFVKESPNDTLTFAADYFRNLYKFNAWNAATNSLVKSRSDQSSSIFSCTTQATNSKYTRRTAVAAEKFFPTETDDAFDNYLEEEKCPESIKQIKEAARTVFLFSSLNEEELDKVVKAMFKKETHPGEIIIEKGHEGDNFYVIGSGIYEAFIWNEKEPVCVKCYHGEGYFGEISLMYNCPRTATVISRSKGTLWALDRNKFREIVMVKAFEKRQNCCKILQDVEIFKSLTNYELNNIADSLTRRTYRANERILKQNDEAQEMFIIESGEVVVTRTDNHHEKDLFKLYPGDYFGEVSLLTNQLRQMSVYATTDVEVMIINKFGFERLFGSCLEVLKQNLDRYDLILQDGHYYDKL